MVMKIMFANENIIDLLVMNNWQPIKCKNILI